MEKLVQIIGEVDVFVEKNPDRFIERVLKDDVSYGDKQTIQKAQKTLNDIKLEHGQLTADLKKNNTNKDDSIKKKKELQIQVDLEQTKITESYERITILYLSVSRTKSILDGLWFWELSAKIELQDQLSNLEYCLSNEKSNFESLGEKLRDCESDIENIKNDIKFFRVEEKRIANKIEKVSHKDSEMKLLKNEKEEILKKLIDDKTILNEEILSKEKVLKANEIDIKHKKEKLNNEKVRLKNLNEEIEHAYLLKSTNKHKISGWKSKIMNLKEGIEKVVNMHSFLHLFYLLNIFQIFLKKNSKFSKDKPNDETSNQILQRKNG